MLYAENCLLLPAVLLSEVLFILSRSFRFEFKKAVTFLEIAVVVLFLNLPSYGQQNRLEMALEEV